MPRRRRPRRLPAARPRLRPLHGWSSRPSRARTPPRGVRRLGVIRVATNTARRGRALRANRSPGRDRRGQGLGRARAADRARRGDRRPDGDRHDAAREQPRHPRGDRGLHRSADRQPGRAQAQGGRDRGLLERSLRLERRRLGGAGDAGRGRSARWPGGAVGRRRGRRDHRGRGGRGRRRGAPLHGAIRRRPAAAEGSTRRARPRRSPISIRPCAPASRWRRRTSRRSRGPPTRKDRRCRCPRGTASSCARSPSRAPPSTSPAGARPIRARS